MAKEDKGAAVVPPPIGRGVLGHESVHAGWISRASMVERETNASISGVSYELYLDDCRRFRIVDGISPIEDCQGRYQSTEVISLVKSVILAALIAQGRGVRGLHAEIRSSGSSKRDREPGSETSFPMAHVRTEEQPVWPARHFEPSNVPLVRVLCVEPVSRAKRCGFNPAAHKDGMLSDNGL
ncbi:predicted protein [Uncinocarpus reesii 1704]|uniref:Uncharacterized protein n=1 Tax=Uncinocarpus reesii (strain UAMH 1704) TaxID=336963 RepID=C4JXG1_UNCRE|nr:uncharacterized protein UREG_06334 [Uncinocarpus reesii 1704]EEP81469.1 predicted protein [Uncinocarpus reesii 1704]